jgi:single-strand DNA-binding protein
MGANFNFNRVILGGRLTADPEARMTQNGTHVCTFNVAVNRRGSKDGQQMSDFISCVAWNERADLIEKYFRKGSSICIVGEIQTRKWQDGNGNNRYTTEVIVNEANFVDSKSDNASAGTSSTYVPDAYKATSFEEASNDEDLPF